MALKHRKVNCPLVSREVHVNIERKMSLIFMSMFLPCIKPTKLR